METIQPVALAFSGMARIGPVEPDNIRKPH